jgi:hypothetical protein
MTGTAAFVRNGRLDILAANQLGSALYAPAFLDPARPVNLARFVFLDRRSREFYGDWDGIAHAAVGSLRAEAGRAPYDRALTHLVGEPGSPAKQALDRLTRWTTTPDQAPAVTSDSDA